MRTIEFKAELRDLESARRQCAALKAEYIGVLEQTDTYFRMPDGRLKKREAPGEPTEWIYYHRPDKVRPRMSNYTRLSDEQAAGFRSHLYACRACRESVKAETNLKRWFRDGRPGDPC